MERWARRVKRFLIVNPEERMPHWGAALFAIFCFGFARSGFNYSVHAGPPRPVGLVVSGIFVAMGLLALMPSTRYLAFTAFRVWSIVMLLAVGVYFAWSLLP
jgi:hypothetical protein